MYAITQAYPESDIAIKLSEWYNWLYSQLEEYETYQVCPQGDTEIESPDQLAEILAKLSYGDYIGAIQQYIVSKLVEESRRTAIRSIRSLCRQTERQIRRLTLQ